MKRLFFLLCITVFTTSIFGQIPIDSMGPLVYSYIVKQDLDSADYFNKIYLKRSQKEFTKKSEQYIDAIGYQVLLDY